MARKRNYKKEYAARKRKAKAAGYPSVTQYSRARRELGLRGRVSPVPRRILENVAPQVAIDIQSSAHVRRRQESLLWSGLHSHTTNSKYSSAFSVDQTRDYYNAFVDNPRNAPSYRGLSRRGRAREKRRRIREYLLKWKGMSESEWEQRYELQAVG